MNPHLLGPTLGGGAWNPLHTESYVETHHGCPLQETHPYSYPFPCSPLAQVRTWKEGSRVEPPADQSELYTAAALEPAASPTHIPSRRGAGGEMRCTLRAALSGSRAWGRRLLPSCLPLEWGGAETV
jgi:hypothetical protein